MASPQAEHEKEVEITNQEEEEHHDCHFQVTKEAVLPPPAKTGEFGEAYSEDEEPEETVNPDEEKEHNFFIDEKLPASPTAVHDDESDVFAAEATGTTEEEEEDDELV